MITKINEVLCIRGIHPEISGSFHEECRERFHFYIDFDFKYGELPDECVEWIHETCEQVYGAEAHTAICRREGKTGLHIFIPKLVVRPDEARELTQKLPKCLSSWCDPTYKFLRILGSPKCADGLGAVYTPFKGSWFSIEVGTDSSSA